MKKDLSGNTTELAAGVPADMLPELKKRRRVMIGGGVGAVLATVKSGSALAGGVCVAPSAFSSISANPATSHRPQTFGQCSSHGWYGNNGVNPLKMDSRWLPVVRATATLSNAGFPNIGPWPNTTKLNDIVKAGSSLWQPDANLIIVYLDIKTGVGGANSLMVAQDVFDMWSILFGSGTTNPKLSGWTSATVRDFYLVWVGTVPLN